jgi:hypothetical protein
VSTRIVVADANVLINLIHAQMLDLLGRLEGYEFVVVDHVEAEITWPDQVNALRKAIEAGWLRREAVSTTEGLFYFRRSRTGDGPWRGGLPGLGAN